MPPPSVTAEQVNSAIDECIKYLERNRIQNGLAKGTWAGHGEQKSGQTCLVTLALLSAGRKPNDPIVRTALNWIKKRPPEKVYEASLQIMVLCAAEPNKDRELIQRNVEWLVEAQLKHNGGWSYNKEFAGGGGDESNSQFALLALWEATKVGIEVPRDTFARAAGYWEQRRKADYSWGYTSTGPSGSMTCAGIASVLIAQDALATGDATVQGEQIQCCGNGALPSVERSLQWLGNNFSVMENPGVGGQWYMYYMYALERVGRLSGQRYIGKSDWYREGCAALLQRRNRLTGAIAGGIQENEEVTTTAMALLFLSKGKRQVVIGHLKYGEEANNTSQDWQKHRRAIQHLTGHVEQVWKKDLSWQTVSLDRASLADLLETPILFISGTKRFSLSEQNRKLLKDYVDQGGFIFAEACNGNGCDGAAFDESFRAEMEAIFDKPMLKLPPSHPVWSAEAKVLPEALPKGFWLYGLDACCRTSVIYSPISLSCRWELARPYGAKASMPKKIEDELSNAVKIGVNVAAYATGRELKEKLDNIAIIQPQGERQTIPRGSLVLPKIMHSGGGDETPRAISNLVEMYRRETISLVDAKTPLISATSPELEKYPVAYIHGRNRFAFTTEEQKGLKRHFENGGAVIGDAICASEEFAESVRTEFGKIIPEATWVRVAPTHALMLKDESGGFDLRSVTMVDPAMGEGGARLNKKEGPAELEALEWNGRYIVIFSPNDISCALESKHSMQCRGYVREDAFRIGINMILFGIMQ